MKITKRLEKAIPQSKCYWNPGDMSVSVHVPANAMTNQGIYAFAQDAISKAGLTAAVAKINVVRYQEEAAV